MTHLKGAVWTERLLLVLILASLAGTLNLVLAIHRRVIRSTTSAPIAGTAQPPSPPSPRRLPRSRQQRRRRRRPRRRRSDPPVPPAPPPKPVGRPHGADPGADGSSRSPGKPRPRAKPIAGPRRWRRRGRHRPPNRSAWKRREMLVRQQVATLSQAGGSSSSRTPSPLDAERDVLARERDALKAALVKGSQRSGYSVLPYKGPNGTWRRPIVLECTNNTVKLQPQRPVVLDDGALAVDPPAIQPGRAGDRAGDDAHPAVGDARRCPGRPLPRLPRPPGRHPPLLSSARAARVAGDRLRLRAGRAGPGRRYPQFRRREDLGRHGAAGSARARGRRLEAAPDWPATTDPPAAIDGRLVHLAGR